MTDQYRVTGLGQALEWAAEDVDGSEAPDLVSSRLEAAKRRIEQDVDRRMIGLINEHQKRAKRRAELLQWQTEPNDPRDDSSKLWADRIIRSMDRYQWDGSRWTT